MDNTFELIYSDEYLLDLEKHLKSGQKNILKKINDLLDELEISPKTGIGKPEILKGFSDRLIYSRRIDQKHRLVYEILEEEKIIKILSAYGHYKDK